MTRSEAEWKSVVAECGGFGRVWERETKLEAVTRLLHAQMCTWVDVCCVCGEWRDAAELGPRDGGPLEAVCILNPGHTLTSMQLLGTSSVCDLSSVHLTRGLSYFNVLFPSPTSPHPCFIYCPSSYFLIFLNLCFIICHVQDQSPLEQLEYF